ncbi:methyltransferase domain-containing protein [Photorhabdus antumapuensis]|uniref:methyltransferase domain-containing protein n=1 Tax=Photorhabdus antumapuensis TaxID=2862867 RepID=UPI001CEDD356|nr:class I SAM-dependent methyltransferase [Photorhabdus antumapuensis]MCA6222269.1 class I SAM-dependent methyltransferase [Photorhabdus antumapuensis]
MNLNGYIGKTLQPWSIFIDHDKSTLVIMGHKFINYKERALFYDIEYNNNYDEEFIVQCISKLNVKSICEIPCATGRNITLISNLCSELHLVDIEEEMLNQAKCKKCNHTDTYFYISDMQNVKLANRVDLIWFPQGALQLLKTNDELFATFRSAYHNLKIGGSLVIDIVNFSSNDLPSYVSNFSDNYLLNWERKLENKFISRYSKSKFLEKRKTIEISFKYEVKVYSSSNFFYTKISMKCIDYHELFELLEASGFKIEYSFGDYKFGLFNPKSPNIILVATRNEN